MFQYRWQNQREDDNHSMRQSNVKSQYQGLNQREDEDQSMRQSNVKIQYQGLNDNFTKTCMILTDMGLLVLARRRQDGSIVCPVVITHSFGIDLRLMCSITS
jgi:hypothetical protein